MNLTTHPAERTRSRRCEHADVVGACPFDARWALSWSKKGCTVTLFVCNAHSDTYALCDTARVLEIDR